MITQSFSTMAETEPALGTCALINCELRRYSLDITGATCARWYVALIGSIPFSVLQPLSTAVHQFHLATGECLDSFNSTSVFDTLLD
jgi:hypothetical protein